MAWCVADHVAAESTGLAIMILSRLSLAYQSRDQREFARGRDGSPVNHYGALPTYCVLRQRRAGWPSQDVLANEQQRERTTTLSSLLHYEQESCPLRT